MLVPNIKKKTTYNTSKDTNTLYIDDITQNGSLFNMEIVTSEKVKDKFIKTIERMIRSSYEYRNYLHILKNELDYTSCTFIPGLDLNNIRIGIEFHHYPFTLYDLVANEIEYEINGLENYYVNPFEIADRILQYHYMNIVGLVPLSITVHELVHDGKKFINEKYIIGNYEKYIKKCKKKIDGEFYSKIDLMRELSEKENQGISVDGSILDVKLLSIVMEDLEEDVRRIELPS